jgi:predicted dehydrogenase
MHKIAVLGANRGILHAKAYLTLPNCQVVGICDRNEELLQDAIGKLSDCSKLTPYTDLDEMLAKEQPEIIHIVTAPNIRRASWFETLVKYDTIKIVVFEKPIALDPDEFLLLNNAVSKYQDRFTVIINHQRRFFSFANTLKHCLDTGILGEIQQIFAMSYGEPMETGTHLMNLVLLATGYKAPTFIMGSVSGNNLIDDPNYKCPDNIQAILGFGDIPVNYYVGMNIPVTLPKMNISESRLESADAYHYTNRMTIRISGSEGYFWWREYGDWGYKCYNGEYTSLSDFYADTDYAQRELSTENLALLDGKILPSEHRCEYSNAKLGLEIIFSIYISALYKTQLNEIEELTQREWELLVNYPY